MFKIKKNFYEFLVLSMILLMFPTTTLFAQNVEVFEVDIVYYDEDNYIVVKCANLEVIVTLDPTIEKLISNNNPRLRRGNYWIEQERTLLTKQTKSTGYITVDKQLRDGYNFPDGGSINIRKGSGSSVSVSLGLSYGYGNVSVSVTPGSYSKYFTGVSVNVPADNYFYLAKGNHYYEIKVYRVAYSNGSEVLYGQQTEKKLVRSSYRAVRSR